MKNVFKFLKIAIATAILGVAVFNATLALNIGKSSDFTLAKIEAVAQGEGGIGDGPCFIEYEFWGGGKVDDGNGGTFKKELWEFFCDEGGYKNPCLEGWYLFVNDVLVDYWDIILYCDN